MNVVPIFLAELPGYCFESVPTPLSAGGVGLFIDQNCKYRVLERVSNSRYQALWIELHLPNNKKSVCGVTYRQHNNANEFLEYLTDFLERQCRQNQNIYLMGDFNIDLLKYETCSYTQTLLQTMQSFSMFPVVDKPTRVYGNSATLIDNIFINNPENNIVSGNIVSDTTDHFSQMCILTSHCKPFFPNNKTKVRDYSTFNAKSFIDDLQNINWNNICKHTDANQSFSRFYKCVNKTINKHAPLRSISNRKQKFLAKPWLTAGLRKSIRVKNNLFYTSDWDKYKFYRNIIISLKRLSKANYYQSFFDLNICNMRTRRVNVLKKDYNFNYIHTNLIKGEKCLLAIFHKRFLIYFSSGNIFFNLVFNSYFKFETFDVLSNTINCRDTTHFESEDDYRTGCRNITHCQ